MAKTTLKERKQKAVELYLEGYTQRQIGSMLGVSHVEAGNYIREVMSPSEDLSSEDRESLREAAQSRYGEYLRAALAEIRSGNYKAIDQAIKTEDRLASMFGLDAPAKQEVKTQQAVVFGEGYEVL